LSGQQIKRNGSQIRDKVPLNTGIEVVDKMGRFSSVWSEKATEGEKAVCLDSLEACQVTDLE
jgi:hypothetical protein